LHFIFLKNYPLFILGGRVYFNALTFTGFPAALNPRHCSSYFSYIAKSYNQIKLCTKNSKNMSLAMKVYKIISIISFLMIMGLHENGVPNFALLAIYLYQFVHYIFNNSSIIFWEGLVVVPILAAIVIFAISRSYKILLFCFLGLLIPLTYATGLITNYARINFWVIFTFATFIIASIAVILLAQKENKL
jgi:hypothetical protein